MLTFRQIWHGSFVSLGVPESNIFLRMALRPGWKLTHVLKILSRHVYFAYPVSAKAAARRRDEVL